MKRGWSGRVLHFTRTQRPVKYYIIDFGLSRRYAADDSPLELPGPSALWATVPEFKTVNLCDPLQ
jgi:hypothetical protein